MTDIECVVKALSKAEDEAFKHVFRHKRNSNDIIGLGDMVSSLHIDPMYVMCTICNETKDICKGH